jgi:hypothetical protein
VKASKKWNVQASDAADLLSVQQTRYAWQQTVEHAATHKMCELLLARTDQQTVSIQTQEKQLAQTAHNTANLDTFMQTTMQTSFCLPLAQTVHHASNMDTLMQSLLESQLEIQSQLGRADEYQQEHQCEINMLYNTIQQLKEQCRTEHVQWHTQCKLQTGAMTNVLVHMEDVEKKVVELVHMQAPPHFISWLYDVIMIML